ncbi:hypothetical protein IFM89_004900 [Coptis chinensis]|uniref:Uncharacterized protein n=1 Tax=Coptis chinensis TaxID=261450 RepID=A0A835LYP5_9MAGN|nr:hypothetical protein IFM89_004900 [Coptis chinensis]
MVGRNPTSHTALDDILPCVDNTTANETLLRSKQVSFQLVNVVNQVITNLSNSNLSYSRTSSLLPVLWFPYSQPFFMRTFFDRSCASGEVEFSNATQVNLETLRTRGGKWRPSIETLFAFLRVRAKLCLSGFIGGMCNPVGHLTPDYL